MQLLNSTIYKTTSIQASSRGQVTLRTVSKNSKPLDFRHVLLKISIRHNKKDGGMSMKKIIFWRIWMDGDYSQMVLHTTKFHSELLYFLRTFACVSCPVCRIIGKVNRYLHCSDMSISQCSLAVKNPVFNRWSRSVDSRIHAKEVSISMKLHDLSKIFLTVVAIDQNSQKIVSRIDTAPSFLLWRIRA